MTISVTHTKVSTIPDGADTDLIRPSDWNAGHTLSGVGTMAEQNANSVAITGGSISGVTGVVTSVTGTAPIASSGGQTPAISIAQATASTDGYLSSSDWSTFNSKQPAGSYLTAVTADSPLSGSGTSGSHLSIAQASASTNGYLSSTDWSTFNSKGSGDVAGPASSTDNAVARFDSTTGKIIQNSVVIVGDTGIVTGVTELTASTKVASPYFDATTSAGGALRNASGTNQIQWGSGGGNNVSVDVSANLNGTNAQIDISPTGTGHVHIKPTGSGSLEIAPTTAGTMNNMVIGGTTPLAVTGTIITANTQFSGAGTGLTGTASSLSIGGNAATVTNGVYTTGSYADPTWITSLAGSKITGTLDGGTF